MVRKVIDWCLKTVEAKKVEQTKKTAGVRGLLKDLLRFLGLREISTAKAREIKITKVKRTRFHGLKCSTATRHRTDSAVRPMPPTAVDAWADRHRPARSGLPCRRCRRRCQPHVIAIMVTRVRGVRAVADDGGALTG
jgi:hypothetical protein